MQVGTQAWLCRLPGYASPQLVDFLSCPYSGQIETLKLTAGIAGDGTTACDLRVNGVSVFTTTPALNSGQTLSSDFPADRPARNFSAHDRITLHTTMVSGTPPQNLAFEVLFKWAGIPPLIQQFQAGQALSALRVVRVQNEMAYYADSSDPTQTGLVAGITITAASSGDPVYVQSSGQIFDSSWNWTIGDKLFFDSTGTLTTNPPATGFVQMVGVATQPTQITVALYPPILR